MALYSAAVEHGYSPEELTQLSLNKFRKRWECFEAKVESKNLDLKVASYKQKKILWDEASVSADLEKLQDLIDRELFEEAWD